jgi:hypothetical protein
MKNSMKFYTCVYALALAACGAAFGQALVVSSFNQNGQLVCTNPGLGSTASVEWVWASPTFYRVRGVEAWANLALIPTGTFAMRNRAPLWGGVQNWATTDADESYFPSLAKATNYPCGNFTRLY